MEVVMLQPLHHPVRSVSQIYKHSNAFDTEIFKQNKNQLQNFDGTIHILQD